MKNIELLYSASDAPKEKPDKNITKSMTIEEKVKFVREKVVGKYYTIRSDGKVLTTRRQGSPGGFIKTWHDPDGYEYVRFFSEGKGKIMRVHRLLAEAFIPNPKSLPQVNHIDGNPRNNSLDNLEWCTIRENERHAYRIGLRKVTSSSGHKYIYREKDKKFRVTTTNSDGSKSYGGRFISLEKAIIARDLLLKNYD